MKRKWLTFPHKSLNWYPAFNSLNTSDIGVSVNTKTNGEKILFLWPQSLNFQMVMLLITKYPSEYFPDEGQASYWPEVGKIIPLSSYLS